MNVQQAKLYQRIQAFNLDDPNASLTFSQRLRRDNGWSATYTQRAIAEYKKFVFLAVVAGHPVTPSDQVDRVWHLHLYQFCMKMHRILNEPPSTPRAPRMDSYSFCAASH